MARSRPTGGVLPRPCCYGDRLAPGLILRDCIVHFLVQVWDVSVCACVCMCVSLHYQSPAGWPHHPACYRCQSWRLEKERGQKKSGVNWIEQSYREWVHERESHRTWRRKRKLPELNSLFFFFILSNFYLPCQDFHWPLKKKKKKKIIYNIFLLHMFLKASEKYIFFLLNGNMKINYSYKSIQ